MSGDPFTNLVSVVTVVMPLEHQANAAVDTTRRHTGKTALLRSALERGSYYADELSAMANLENSGRVYSLLKNDIKAGLIRYNDGLYEKVRN